MFKNTLVLAGFFIAMNANAAVVPFDRTAIDPNGTNFDSTTILSLPLPANTVKFDFSGSLDLNGNLITNQNQNQFGLYLGSNLFKDITFFTAKPNDVYTFDFKGLNAGNYSLRFNIAGNETSRQFSLTSTITPVPEASTNTMMALGLGVFGLLIARRKQA